MKLCILYCIPEPACACVEVASNSTDWIKKWNNIRYQQFFFRKKYLPKIGSPWEASNCRPEIELFHSNLIAPIYNASTTIESTIPESSKWFCIYYSCQNATKIQLRTLLKGHIYFWMSPPWKPETNMYIFFLHLLLAPWFITCIDCGIWEFPSLARRKRQANTSM